MRGSFLLKRDNEKTDMELNEQVIADNTARTHRLEVAVEGIASSLKAFMDATERAHVDFRSEIKDLAKAHNTSQRTPWAVIISAVGVSVTIVIALVSLGASGPIGTLADLKLTHASLDAELHDHRSLEAHPGGVARITALEKTINGSVDAVDRRLTIVEDWQRKNNIESVARHSQASARLDALERVQNWQVHVTANRR